jgi:hypothetical protein
MRAARGIFGIFERRRATRAKRAPHQHPCRRWGLSLNSGSLRIVLLDAIPIRQFAAVFGTGFRSVFPRLKCCADDLCGTSKAALFIVAAGVAPDQYSEFFHHKPPLKACFEIAFPFTP